ncbi:hypothetical protein [Tabrizicola sp. YIM 78059]|uniref:hypothetical protein n=1 Tax=Tabrizicola sp. YIM 78059 TaxID=2529861 RepID=UPI0010AA05C0|nr:hypothetical protein [Tabrizicola sp. YIM 78059]
MTLLASDLDTDGAPGRSGLQPELVQLGQHGAGRQADVACEAEREAAAYRVQRPGCASRMNSARRSCWAGQPRR